MEITAAQILTIMPSARERAPLFVEPLNTAMARFEINTLLRAAHFLSQVAHESGELRWLRELWGPTPAQMAYEGRADLGNTEPGDGKLFLGRGPIQISGRGLYGRASLYLFGDARLLTTPELLEQRDPGCQSTAWFWAVEKGLNALADKDEFLLITKRVNGGTNGLNQRQLYLQTAKTALGVAA